MKIKFYKFVLTALAVFFYFVATKLYKDASIVNEDTIVTVFNELDGNKDGVLKKDQLAFVSFCAGNQSLQQQFTSAKKNLISLKEFQLGLRPFMSKASQDCKQILRKLTDPYEIEKMEPKQRKKSYMALYDLNKNGKIEWKQYTLVNRLFGTDMGESVTVFTARDANGDFTLDKKQV